MNTNSENKIIKKQETHKSKLKNLFVYKDGSIRKIVIFFIFAAVGFIIYSNTLQSPFVFDDTPHIPENPHIRITELNVRNIMDAGFKSHASHRPVANISFALNYYFHRYNLIGYHLTNIFIHILTGILLFYFFKNTLSLPPLRQKIKNPDLLSLTAAVLWLAHPLQTQSVTYIVQRMNSLAAMFYILSMLLYVKARLKYIEKKRSWPWFTACIPAGLLALGCKEIAATLPVFILLYEWYFFQDLNRDWLRRRAPYFIGAILIIIFLAIAYLGLNPIEKILVSYQRRDFNLLQRLLTQNRVIIFYITLIFFPHPSRLNFDHDFAISYSLINPATTIISMLIILLLIMLAIISSRKNRILSFGILWFFGNLAIESSVLGLEIIFEHRLYLPSMFLILAIVVLIWRLIKIQWIKLAVFSTLAVLLSIATFQRNTVWADGLTLWSDCAAKSPEKARPQLSLANELREAGKINEALRYYNKTIELDPNFPGALFNLGLCFYEMQDFQQAIAKWEEVAKARPAYAKVYSSLGKAYYQQKNYEKAESAWNKALKLEKNQLNVANNLANLYLAKGDIENAVTLFEKSLSINPDQIEILNNLSWLLSTNIKYQNDPNSVLLAEKACLITNYKQPNLLDTLAAAYASTGKFEKAIEAAQKAVQLAEADGNKKLAEEINRRIELYKAGQSYQQLY